MGEEKFKRDLSKNDYFELYKNFTPTIYTILSKLGIRQDDKEDLQQEVFYKILANVAQLRDEKAAVSWIMQIAQRTIIDKAKSYGKEDRKPLNTRSAECDDLLDGMLIVQRASMLDNCICKLSEHQKSLVKMRYYQQAKWCEIADKYGLKEDTARKRTKKALQLIRTCLKKNGINS